MFYKRVDRSGSFRNYLLEKINTRMVPYIAFGLLTYCVWLFPILLRKYGIYQGSNPVPDSLYLKPLVGMFYGIGDSGWLPHNSLLWFLACLFVTEIIFFLTDSISKTKLTLGFSLLLFAVCGYIDSVYFAVRLPFSIDIAFTAIVFYGLGYLLKDHLLGSDSAIGFVIICLLTGFGLGFINDRVDMNYNVYGNPLLFYASSFFSIYGYICVAKRITRNRILSFVGANSLTFFLLQNTGFFVVNILAYMVLRLRLNALEPNIVYACSYVLLSMLVLFPAVFVIARKAHIMTRGFKSPVQDS